ncbi:MAG: hypothetical protein NWE93_13310 [Candidatus Bathyarchaeota archaeon]|nr:hypothetical protein [Candidatus Bathyarchaeota archaeon]
MLIKGADYTSSVPHLPTKTLLCGCVYEENDWMLIRVKECEKHHKARHRKIEYRPKAECNRNDTRGE